ncbi:MAG: RrF2 family transcriptional regulator [Bilophila wadsworthia]
MRYSTRTRYGLRFLINLAGRPAGSCVQLAEIAREEGVSVKYLEQIVRVLRPAGILRSARGAKGGYALAKSPDAIRMDEVFERLEGHISRWNACT